MFYLNTLCKQLDPVNGIMVRFWHRQKRICNLVIFLIGSIIINAFFFDDLCDIRRICKIIQKTVVDRSLTVNALLRLLDDRLHILHITASNHRTLSAVTIESKNRHWHQSSHDQKKRQLVPVFHVFDTLKKSVHPPLFLSCRIPDCFHSNPGNSGRSRTHLQILPSH